jgi:hypothetical protein
MASLGSLQDNQKNSYAINADGDVAQRVIVSDVDGGPINVTGGPVTVTDGPLRYKTDGTPTDVNENTTTPSLTTALPVTEFKKNTVPTIFNVLTGLANTESSQALPSNTKRFIIKARGNTRIQMSYSIGTSGSNYFTIEPGASYEDENYYVSQTIYFQCNKATQTIEIITYT